MRPLPAAAWRTAIAVGAALLASGGWWWVRGPAVERHAVAPPPAIDIDPPAMRARRDAAIALATMPDDPWTLAESLAASAPDRPATREKEDCGLAGAPQFARSDSADQESAETRAASPGYLAAQARIDAALRASADPLDRVTADFVNAGDQRTPEGVEEAVAQQAAVSTDPRVVALGYGVCSKSDARSPACASLTAERWAQVDAGNGVPWMELLAQARERGDDAAVRDAMARLAAATRFDTYLFAPAGAIVRRMPDERRDLAAGSDLAARAIGQAAALPLPGLQSLGEACRDRAGGDEQRAGQCRAISDAMYAHSDTLIAFVVSGSLLQQATGDTSRRDLIKAERAVATAHWSPGTGYSLCADLRDVMHRLRRNAEIGEVEAMREEARRFVAP